MEDIMRPNYTHLIIVLDKSGSMADLASDTIGGVNRLVAEQKALPGNFTSSLYLFNGLVSEVDTFVELNTTNYQPQGSTALLDAVCIAIDTEGLELSRLPEKHRPDKVIVLIVTDGQENASVKFKREDVRTRIKTQTDTYKCSLSFWVPTSMPLLKPVHSEFPLTAPSNSTSLHKASPIPIVQRLVLWQIIGPIRQRIWI